MSEGERLREVLVEVQSLREREAKALKQTQTLLAIFEDVAIAPSPGEAIANFLDQVRIGTGADFVEIVTIQDSLCSPTHVSPATFEKTSFQSPVNFGKKQRRYADLHKISGWKTDVEPPYAGQRSLLTSPFEHSDGTPGSLLCFHQEIGRFGLAEAELVKQLGKFAAQLLNTLAVSQQNALLAAVIDGSSTGFAISDAQDPEMPLVFVNNAFEQITGYTSEEITGLNCRFLSAEPKDSEERTRLRDAVANRTSGQFLLRNKRKDGSSFWNDLSLFPVVSSDHTVTHLVATQTDASEKVSIAQERQMAQDRLEAILSHTNDAFVLLLTDGTIGFANTAHEHMFPAKGINWRAGSTFKDNWNAYINSIPMAQKPEDTSFLEFDPNTITKNRSGVRIDLPDGKHVILRAEPTEDGNLVMSATDITSLQNTERLLQQRAVAIENTSEGIGIADEMGRIVYANPSLLSLFGLTKEHQLIGRKWRNFYSKDNDSPLLKKLSALDASNLRVPKKYDDQNMYHETVASMVDGVGEVFVVRNVTNRITLQERQSQLDQELEASSRRDAVSKLAAGVAHDLNNLLSVISASSTMMNLEADAAQNVGKHATRISKAASQGALLANRLLDVADTTETESVFDLRTILTSVEDLVFPNLKPGIKLELSLPDDPVLIAGQPSDGTQVFVNLILNANDACSEGQGEVTVTLTTGQRPPPEALMKGEWDANTRYAGVQVSDNGSGIPSDVIDRIFEPYFSTKGQHGTGIGLPMVANIVERFGGVIAVASSPGKGTEFSVYWPICEDLGKETPDGAGRPNLDGLTFLMVDDDPNVTDVVSQYLEALGAEVSAISDPELALEVVLDGDGWSALITDYEMPEMNGGDLVEKIRAANVTLPIYMATGLAKRLSDPRVNEASVRAVFAKPLDLRKLANKLASDFAQIEKETG